LDASAIICVSFQNSLMSAYTILSEFSTHFTKHATAKSTSVGVLLIIGVTY
jgi:hypothetical protein